MGLDAKAKFRGLVTATAEATGEPSGLRIADNVVLRKEGALMCRPVLTTTALSRAYLAAFPYKGSLYYVGASNVIYSPSQSALLYAVTGTSPAAVRADIQSAKEARGNLYFATAQGAFKVCATSDTALRPSGLSANAAVVFNATLTGSGTPLLLAANQHVAYRIVGKYTDPNGLIVRSRPSAAVNVDSGGGAASPVLTLQTNGTGNQVVDEVEVYRTRIFPSSATVDDEMQLVASVKFTQFVFVSGRYQYTFTDRVADTARSTTLYTSPSRGGIENASDRAPGAACIERFRGSLFFGNTKGPQRLVVSWKYASSGNLVGQATGIGNRTVTGNTTNGSPTITSVSNTTGLQVGQFLQSGQGYITNIAGSTITISGPMGATATGASLSFVDGLLMNVYGTTYGWVTGSFSASTAGLVASGAPAGSLLSAYEVTPPAPGFDITLVIETFARDFTAVEFRASHGDEYSPPIALGNAVTPTYSTFDDLPNGLAWSEPDEPEHVPPKNFARVGDTGKAILGLVATRDRLLIFKEDGLFMLTGNTARDFAIYPLDTTCLCILPGSIRRLQDTVYLLTNLGLAAVDESGGVTIVSRPIQNEVARIVSAIRVAQRSSGLYNMPGLTGTTAAADEANGEYWLALGSSAPTFGGHVLVYSLPRDGFTTFTFTTAPVCLATDGEGGPLMLTASALGTPTTLAGVFGAVAARVSPRAFCDPALLGKLWTHVVAGFSELTGTTDVQARFTSAESMSTSPIVTETFDLPTTGALVQFPNGSLIRHPMPRAVARAYMLVVELLINVSSGTFTLESIAAESRENIANKKPTHGTGVT